MRLSQRWDAQVGIRHGLPDQNHAGLVQIALGRDTGEPSSLEIRDVGVAIGVATLPYLCGLVLFML